jgi:hypothetical protein
MEETAHFFTEDLDDYKKRRFLEVDEGVAIFLNLLVSCSAWSAIDAIVLTIADGDGFIAVVFYAFITLFGTLAYFMFASDNNSLHARMPEVLALAVTCVGSWGVVNSTVTMAAAHSSKTETAIHLSIVVVASLAIFLHHTYRRPNFIFDLILK